MQLHSFCFSDAKLAYARMGRKTQRSSAAIGNAMAAGAIHPRQILWSNAQSGHGANSVFYCGDHSLAAQRFSKPHQ
ncbi:hypothetical protein AYI96_15935 [Shewanella sp. MSW]|nr:hypothetical protein BFS86_06315 [Shewanella algae]TVP09474.1 hypothetical protein AYI96_15935 [Shewanella sp. MSW]